MKLGECRGFTRKYGTSLKNNNNEHLSIIESETLAKTLKVKGKVINISHKINDRRFDKSSLFLRLPGINMKAFSEKRFY